MNKAIQEIKIRIVDAIDEAHREWGYEMPYVRGFVAGKVSALNDIYAIENKEKAGLI